MSKKIWLAPVLLATYVVVSSLLHYVILPEPEPDQSDIPRSGATVQNEGIHSKFVYRRTSIETDGQLFEWDNFVDPGGGPMDIPHVHPHMRESFQVLDGEMLFLIDGREHVVKAGETIVAEPGHTHAFQNRSQSPVYMVSRFEPAEEGRWDELARKGLLVDSTFVQFERAGGLGRISPVQLIVFGSRYKQGYRPGLPIWLQDMVSFLVAPTARIFGVHAYYPPARAR